MRDDAMRAADELGQDKKSKALREFAKAEKLSDIDLNFVAAQAELGDANYERGRKAAAAQMGVGVRTLDRLRKAYCAAMKPDAGSATQADILLGIAQQAQLFHNAEGVAYADITVNGHRETWPVTSKGFRDWITREYFRATKAAPASYGMDAALGLIEARARFDAPTQEVYLRTARLGDKIYLDLCDNAWRAVEIDKDGWRIAAAPPARFRRARGMLPLPTPEKGGSVDDLRPFLNVAGEDDFILAVGWTLGALSGSGPYPVLVIAGEHGAAKTFFGRILRELVDPNKVPQRALPRHDHDLYIAGGNALVLAFDNISTLPDWLSDTLCRLSTGGGFAARELYTDADEKLFDGMRPLILNGIEDFVVRPDLGDRTIALVLEEITGDKRRTEASLWTEFETARPKILGALLDVVAHGLGELKDTTLAELPRMADFALWVAACEEALWSPGTFQRVYAANRQSGQVDLLDTDAVAVAMQKFAEKPPLREREDLQDYNERVAKGGTMWEGTAAKLLGYLNEGCGSLGMVYATDETRRDRRWPRTPRQFGGRLRRMAPAMRLVGVEIAFSRGHESTISVSRRPKDQAAAGGTVAGGTAAGGTDEIPF